MLSEFICKLIRVLAKLHDVFNQWRIITYFVNDYFLILVKYLVLVNVTLDLESLCLLYSWTIVDNLHVCVYFSETSPWTLNFQSKNEDFYVCQKDNAN